MVGKVTDEMALQELVSAGIFPAIQKAIDEDDDYVYRKVDHVGRLVNTYYEFFQTGNRVYFPEEAGKK